MIGTAVVAYLNTVSQITDITSTRIRLTRLIQGETRPAIRVTHAGGLPDHTLDGAGGSAEASVQIDCFAETDLAAAQLADKVRIAMQAISQTTAASVLMLDCTPENGPRSIYYPPDDASDVADYATSYDFQITFMQDTSFS